MRRLLSARQLLLLLIPLAGLVGGCASSRSAGEVAASRAAVIGTWKYQVDGMAPLDRGVFHITSKNGRLRGIVRDQRRGRLFAEVRVNDSRMELTLGNFLISGRIEDGQFMGTLRRERWDVTVPYRVRRRSRFRSASFYARRVQSAAAADLVPILECRSILREANGCG